MNISRLAALCAVTGAMFCTTGVSAAPTAGLTPFKIERTIEPRFPAGLLIDAVTKGDAWVLVSVGSDGKLMDALATRYTHPAFAKEALFAIGKWRYDPAQLDGKAVTACAELHFHFEATGAVISMNPMATIASLTSFVRQTNPILALCNADELDQPPKAVHTVVPASPPNAAAGGKVLIDFIIDETGQPRMQVLVHSTGEEFSHQAAAALAQWRFTPPTRRGQPISVPARQEFVFPPRA